METINNLASTASKAIWGDGTTKPETEEPVSGVTGNTAAGEPFDAGNKEPSTTTTAGLTDTKSSPTSTAPLTDVKTDTPTSGPAGTTAATTGLPGLTGTSDATTHSLTDRTKESSKPVTGHDDPEGTHGPHDSKVANAADPRVDSDKDGRDATTSTSTSHSTSKPVTGHNDPEGTHGPHDSKIANAADPRVDSDKDGHGATTGSSKDVKPSATVNSGNDTRDPSDAMDLKTAEARHNVDTSAGVDASENPVKVDGPGPKPVEELAREHGGDAAAASGGTSTLPGEEKPESKTAGEGEDPNVESKGEGTGEQYVKSSGLKADGGDFDATKPGAGREADRLLEVKGIHNPATEAKDSKGAEITPTASKSSDHSGSPDTKEKKSLKDKIKAKLHKDKA